MGFVAAYETVEVFIYPPVLGGDQCKGENYTAPYGD